MFFSFFIPGLEKKNLSCFPEFQQKEKHIYLRKINQRYYEINNKGLLFHTVIYKNCEISN